MTSATTGSVTEGTRVLKCPLLTAHNWTLWKHRMMNHLRERQLWDVVDPTGSTLETASEMARETRAAGKAAAIASADDSLQAAKALDLIESHISEELLSMLLAMDGPREVWVFLTHGFKANSIAHQSAIQLQFQNLSLRSGQTIDSYIREANNLFFRLSSVGINLSHLQLINQVLDGLPKSYYQPVATVRTSLTLTQQISLTLVHQTLLAEELRQAAQRRNNPHNAHTAHYTSRAKAQSSGSGNSFNHSQPASRDLGNRRHEQLHHSQSRRPPCKHCHRSNHPSEKCWQQFPEKRPQRRLSSNVGKTESQTLPVQHPARISALDDSECALSSLGFEVPTALGSSPLWYLDSACTNHITCFGNSLQYYDSLSVPQHIRVGNGETVDAIEIGTVVLPVITPSGSHTVTLSGVNHAPGFGDVSLLSLGQQQERGASYFSSPGGVTVVKGDRVVLYDYSIGRLYRLRLQSAALVTTNSASRVVSQTIACADMP